MKDRIQKFLEIENISPSKFADEIGVQRSSISHILSGRNNPSLDLIQKILHRFSYINAEWLITGKGEMFKPERHPTLFDYINQPKETVSNQKTDDKDDEPIEKEHQTSTHNQLTNLTQEIPNKQVNTHKIIDKIIVLYNDGTASIYQVTN